MYIRAATLDDLLRRVFGSLLKNGMRIQPRRGAATDLSGVLLHLTSPKARLSRTETKGRLFSSLGELCWYLAKSDALKFITYYVPSYGQYSQGARTVYGAYGPRLFAMRGHNQVAIIIKLLKRHQDSRRAVIQLFDALDIARERPEVPCTCTLQFLIRAGHVEMLTSMRSNDAFLGLPHDIFAFTMLQEIVARSLALEPGSYKHFVGSLHLYETDRPAAKRYLAEGWQQTMEMPPMPDGNPWPSLRAVMASERTLRSGAVVDVASLPLDEYWKDLIRLLQVYRHFRDRQPAEMARVKRQMSARVYDPYITSKQLAARRRLEQSSR